MNSTSTIRFKTAMHTGNIQRNIRCFLMLLLAMAGMYSHTKAQTTVNLTPTIDATIKSSNTGVNYGNCNLLQTDGGSGNIDRSLLKFDLSGIPSGAIITSASLSLVKTSGVGASVDIRRITSAWNEGSGGCGGSNSAVSWNQRITGTNWTTSGGDFNGTVEATTTVGSNNTTYTWNVLSLVQNWTNGTNANHGLMVKNTSETSGALNVFASSENTTVANRPKLTVTYTVLNITGTVTNLNCYNVNTGAIDLSVSGGVPPYTYDWNNNGLTQPASYPDPQDISSLAPGFYIVYVKDNVGNTGTKTFFVSTPGQALTLSRSITNVTTAGANNGAVDLTVSGGTPGYTYAWTRAGGGFSATTQDISGLSANTYSVTVTDANGCTATTSAVVATNSNLSIVNKQLYFSDTLKLDRVNPANPVDLTTLQTTTLSSTAPTVTFDATNSVGTTTTSVSVPITVGTGANRLMMVGVSIRPKDGETVSTINYNIGSTNYPLTLVGGPTSRGSDARVYIYRLLNPVSGNGTVNVTFNNAVDKGAVVGVTTFSNVDQTTPLTTYATANGDNTTPSVNVTSVSGGMVFDVVAAKITSGLTPGAGQTERWDRNQNEIRGASSTEPSSGASTTMSWTVSKAKWVMAGVGIRPASAVNNITFTEAPVLCSALTIKAGNTITVRAYVNIISGSMPANPTISAHIRYGVGNTSLINLTNASYSAVTGMITWTGTLGADVTVPAGSAINLLVTTTQANVGFTIRYDSQTYPSSITLPVSTYINVNSLQVFNASFPSGSVITNVPNTGASYVRVAVSDPFGTSDINGVTLTLIKPGGSTINANLTAANVISTSGCVKTYQYALLNPGDLGAWSITATAIEGTEGTVTHSASTNITVITPTGPVTQNSALYLDAPLCLSRDNPADPLDNTISQSGLLATVATFTDTITTTKSTYNYQNQPTRNFGTDGILRLENENNYRSNSFIEFDLSSIPSGATITSAQLRLVHSNGLSCDNFAGGGGTVPTEVRRVNRAWVEGTVCNTTQAGSLTYNSAGGSNWTAAGGDFDATVYGSFSGSTADAQGTVYITNVLSLVNGWYTNSFSNFGMILRSANTQSGENYYNIYSDDAALASNRPRLIVTYTLPAAGSTTFTQCTNLCSPLTIEAGEPVTVSAYVSVASGSMPANPNITAQLKYGTTNIITLSSPTYNSGTGIITWTGTLGADVTVPSGQAIALEITTAQAGVSFRIDYDAVTKPSRIDLPISSYVNVTSMAMYDAPYPGGNIITNANFASTVYVRATATNPFGATDINGMDITINGAGGSNTVAASLVNTNAAACSRTYEYAWVPSHPAGDYNLSVRAKSGTEGTIADFEIMDFSFCPFEINANISNAPSCDYPNAGQVTLTLPNNNGPFTYTYTGTSSGSGSGLVVDSLSVGTYTITVSSSSVCSGSTVVTLNAPIPPQVTMNVTNASCLNNDGAIEVSVVIFSTTGANIPAFWGDGNSGLNRTNLAPGFYDITVTDSLTGCTTTATAQVEAGDQISGTAFILPVNCTGGTGGSVNLTPSGGSGTYTSYAWSRAGGGYSATTQDISGLQAGLYTVVITESTGCTGSVVFDVPSPDPITFVTDTTAVSCSSGGSIAVDIAGGTAPYITDWADVAGTSNVQNRINIPASTYSLTVTDAKGCTASTTILMDLPVCDPTAYFACNSNATDAYSVASDPNVISYTWSVTGGGIIVSGQGTPAVVVDWTAATPGNAQICVRTENNCGESNDVCRQIYVRQAAASATASSACLGSSFGLFANGGQTYTWSGPNGFISGIQNPVITNATGAQAGTYQVTVTDDYGCEAIATVAVTINAVPSVTAVVDSPSCSQFDGSITANPTGGTSPYTYTWSTGESTQMIEILTAGTYQVVVQDANGCTVSLLSVAANIEGPTDTIAKTNILCFGGSTGTATSTPVGGTSPYTYQWSNGATTSSVTGLPAGPISVLITDANGCETSSFANITAPDELMIDQLITNVSCNGGNNGAINLIVTGGTVVYTYDWLDVSGTSNPRDRSGLAAGTYSVIVRDANNCTRSATFTISQPQAIATNISALSIGCNGGSDGAVNLNVSGGTSPYTYAWTRTGGGFSETTQSLLNVLAGTYNVTITDARGCTATTSATVNQAAALVLSRTSSNPSCFGGSNGSVDLTVSGGTSPYNFTWSNGATTEDISGLVASTYSVSVTDANNCAANTSVTISQPTQVSASITGTTPSSCFGTATGTATAQGAGGTGAFTYSWNTSPVQNTQTAVSLSAGIIYDVIVSDANGCTAITQASVTQPTALSASAFVKDVNCAGGSNGEISLNVAGGAGSYTFDWLDIAGTSNPQNRTNLTAGTYSVVISDANGCSTSSNYTVNEPSSLTASLSTNNVTCNGANNGSIDLTVNGGVSPYSYVWSNGQITEDITAVSPGGYTVTVTDVNGCTITTSTTINQPAALTVAGVAVDNCPSQSNGSINLTVSGGTSPYGFDWSNGDTTEDLSGLSAATYSVLVTDSYGCTATASFTLTSMSATFTSFPVSCVNFGTPDYGVIGDGEIYTIIANGTAPFTYTWTKDGNSFPSTSQNISSLSWGTYQATITDANGCTFVATAILAAPTCLPPVAVNDTFLVCNYGYTGSVATNDTDPNNTLAELEFLPLDIPLTNEGTLDWDTSYNGGFTFIPASGFSGTVLIRYLVNDPIGLTDTGLLVLNVIGTNAGPDQNVQCVATAPGATMAATGTGTWTLGAGSAGTATITSNTNPTTTVTGFSDPGVYYLIWTRLGCSDTALINADDCPVANVDTFSVMQDSSITRAVDGNDVMSRDGGNTFAIVCPLCTSTSNGNLVFNANGTFTYTPNSGYFGTDQFIYQLCDIDGDCDTAIVYLTIKSSDDVPVALNDTNTTSEDIPVSGDVTGNDTLSTDGGNVWTLIGVNGGAANGTVVMDTNGLYTYTPNANFHGVDVFTYRICDIDGDCDTATVTITINPVNDVPVAVNDTNTTNEDTPVSGTSQTNDTPSGDGGNVWTLVGVDGGASNGTVTMNPDGSYTYTPDANFNGTDVFTYRVCDVDGDCDTATVTITINPVNDVPVAVNDTNTTNEDTPVSGTSQTNDTPSGDGGNVWTLVGVDGGAANGTVTMNPDGSYTYTPDANFNGTDVFTYRVCDIDGDCDTATVTITINPVNDVPVAVNDTNTTNEDTPVSGTSQTNDTPSGDGGNVWTLVGVDGGAANGTVTMNPDGSYTYTPDANFNGTDVFTYRVCDIDGDCDTATVTITINPVNDVPVAVNDTNTTNEDTPVSGTSQTNDTPSGDGGNVWTLVGVDGGAANGTVTMNPDGSYTYTPDANFNGTDVFTYRVCDIDGDCDTATVTITINPVNDVPVAVNDTNTTNEDTPVSGTSQTNDTPSGDGGNVWTLVGVDGGAANGTVTMNPDGSYTYTPDANFNGTDVFTYRVCDVDGDCDTATVTITINPVNDVPVAVNDTNTTNEDTPVSGTSQTNDTPSGDGGNTWTLVGVDGGAANGTVTMNPDGSYTYTPDANFNGTDVFTYRVCDMDGDCDTATVTITINPVNDVPVAVNDTNTTMRIHL
jgi:large repetitive protein